MAAEEAADDEALYDVWRRLDEPEVAAIHDRLDALAELVRQRRGRRPTRDMLAEAHELRDGPLRLGFLPVVAELVANE